MPGFRNAPQYRKTSNPLLREYNDEYAELKELSCALGLGLTMDEGLHYKLESSVYFEPHGVASESWDEVWLLTLCRVQRHVREIKAGYKPKTKVPLMDEDLEWRPCGNIPMTFRGRTARRVVQRAVAFLNEVKPDTRWSTPKEDK
jgi:hypothetical protein